MSVLKPRIQIDNEIKLQSNSNITINLVKLNNYNTNTYEIESVDIDKIIIQFPNGDIHELRPDGEKRHLVR